MIAAAVRGLFIDLMDIDAAQYAAIAQSLAHHGNWLQVHYRGRDYLDKPPLLFWSAAVSFLAFGVHVWSYKLPSVLAAGLGVFSVHRFSRHFYSPTVARFSVAILAGCVGVALMCNDVRTDALLFGTTACAVWLAAEYGASKRWRDLAGFGVAAGLAMLAKGPIGLVMPGFAIGTHLLLRRDWRALFNWRWLVALAIVALMLLPMCWGLYQQFDLHPEKVVGGATGVSGLRFFFWDQSFGRISGSNPWKNDTSVFTFFHDYLWIFLPWTLLFIGALWQRGRQLVVERFRIGPDDEGYSMGGFALTFAALSLSHYKLPHYVFVTLPWASVLTARWLAVAPRRVWWHLQSAVLLVMGIAVALVLIAFPPGSVLLPIVLALGAIEVVREIIREPAGNNSGALMQRTFLVAAGVVVAMNFDFYPGLLPYQSTSRAPAIARSAGAQLTRIAYFRQSGPALDFYARQTVPSIASAEQVAARADSGGAYWLYTDPAGRRALDSAGVSYVVRATMPHFDVSRLTGRFLNPVTRATTLRSRYWLEVQPNTTAGPP